MITSLKLWMARNPVLATIAGVGCAGLLAGLIAFAVVGDGSSNEASNGSQVGQEGSGPETPMTPNSPACVVGAGLDISGSTAVDPQAAGDSI